MSEELEPKTEVTEESEVVTPEKKKKKEKSKAQKIIEWVLFGIFIAIFGVVAAGVIDAKIHQKDNYNQELRFGWGSFIVLTNSMEPEYMVDTALITYKEDLNKVTEFLKSIDNINVVKDDADEFVASFTKDKSLDMTFMNVGTGINPYSFPFVNDEYNPNIPGSQSKCITSSSVMTHRIRELHVYKNVEYGKGRFVFVTAGINDKGEASKIGQYQFVTEKEYLGMVKLNSAFIGKVFKFISSIWGLLVLLLIPAAYLIVTSAIDIFKVLRESEEKAESEPKAPSSLDILSDKDRERLKQELLDEMIESKKGENKDNEN